MLCMWVFMCTFVNIIQNAKQILSPTIKPNFAKLAFFCYKGIDYYKILIPDLYIEFSRLQRINHGSLTKSHNMYFLKVFI